MAEQHLNPLMYELLKTLSRFFKIIFIISLLFQNYVLFMIMTPCNKGVNATLDNMEYVSLSSCLSLQSGFDPDFAKIFIEFNKKNL